MELEMSPVQLESRLSNILSTKKIWTEEQAKIYQSLLRLVKSNQEKFDLYKLNLNREQLVQKINEQPWLEECVNKSKLQSLINNSIIELNEKVIEEMDGGDHRDTLRVTINFPSHRFKFHIYYSEYFRGNKRLQVHSMSFFSQLNNDKVRAYFTFYDNVKNKKYQETLRLPQFEQIYQVTGKNEIDISKSSFVKLFTEIVIFFDEKERIANTKIGLKYPLSLNQLKTQI